MQIVTRSFTPGEGWCGRLPAELDSPRTLILAFGPSATEPIEHGLADVQRAFPTSAFLGCSTAGEILGDRVTDGALVLSIVRFDETGLRRAAAPVTAACDSYKAALNISRELTDPSLRAVVVISDGLHVNGSELIRGFNDALQAGVVVTGGLAADGNRFARTWVVANGVPAEGVVTAVGLYGDALRVGHGSRGGWDMFGPERTVTRSEGNVLYALDGRPALALYKEYLGELAADLPGSALLFPLAIRSRERSDEVVVRTILGVDEEAMSLTFAGDIPEGAIAQLMSANMDRLVEAAAGAACQAMRPASASERPGKVDGPTLCLAVSCVGRRLILGERAEEELEACLEALPVGAQQVGFYSYGEISPLTTGQCDLHNQTMTVTTFSEDCANAPRP